ncbi:alpha-amylase family glycosyl hydrolase, partial [Streptobacillus moniliformis]|uniref:alpha-amylase family glycosyl hydrolase n=1 Tax=Streptobacillus moniliformis TaxID=34105 RepID=UPI000AA75B40
LIFSCNKFKEHENTHDDKIAKTGIYYEIFVRSFADSNGDGIGDLNGIRAKLPELKDLGIEGLWLTPIFPTKRGSFKINIIIIIFFYSIKLSIFTSL